MPASRDPFLNLMLFLSNHIDHTTHPKARSHNLPLHCFGTKLFHETKKEAHRLWSTPETPHHSRTFIQMLHEKRQVKRICEFDSTQESQKGQHAFMGSIMPFSTRKSPVFSFSKFASQMTRWTRGGTLILQMRSETDLGRIGVYNSYSLLPISLIGNLSH